MIYILDTDHFSALDRGTAAGLRFRAKMDVHKEMVFTTIITYEQVLRGWLARLRQCKDPHEEIEIYARLKCSAEELSEWDILLWDEESVTHFDALRKKVRVGTLDLKIASIALAHDAIVLTRNTVDFAKVPGLKFENWLD